MLAINAPHPSIRALTPSPVDGGNMVKGISKEMHQRTPLLL